MVEWIVNRLREPSSWAGLGSLAMLLGLSNEQWLAIGQIGAGVAALLAILLQEHRAGKAGQ